MNIVDLLIIIILGITTLYGAYRGFLHSLFSLGASLASLLLSFVFAPSFVNAISSNSNIVNLIKYYTDNASKINSLGTSTNINNSMVSSVLDRLQLAYPLDIIIKSAISDANITNAAEVNEIVSQAIISVAINILAFILCYFIIFILFTILINLLNSTFKFPLIKYGDMIIGAALGFAKGIVFVFVIFTIMPVIQNALPFDELKQIFTQSEYYSRFLSDSLILRILQL